MTAEHAVLLADRYQLGAVIGVGGMGRVVEAWDTVLDVKVAIKLLATEVRDRASLARFRREATASARLGHPNIVVTHDVVPMDDGLALVMEHVAGPSLRAFLHARGTLDDALTLDLARQLAAGLSAVHAVGIVHRDLKPANLLLEPREDGYRLKIADFGIASLPGAAQLTRVGTVLGTPAYMAPERFRGVASTASEDVYAMGVILYELLTGRPPIDADAPLEVLGALMRRDRHHLVLPPSPLASFIEQCVDFVPSRRPVDGSAAVARLQQIAPTEPAPVLDEDGAVVVLGGLPASELLPLVAGLAEVGQALGGDIVLRFDAPEAAFRWVRDIVSGDPRVRASFDAGTVVGRGVGLFAGEAVGRAARLVRVATAGELLVGPGGRRALGLGLRAGLEPLGSVHLAGVPRDTVLYRVRAEQTPPSRPISVRVADGVGWVECRCHHAIESAPRHLTAGARIACSRCGRVLRIAPVQTHEPPGDAATRDLVVLHPPAEDASILNLLASERNS